MLHPATSLAIVFLLLVFVVGVPGNLVTLIVYLRRARKSSTYVFISFMAISDLLVCLFVPFLIWFMVQLDGNKPNPYLCKCSYFILSSCLTLSFMSSAAVGFDRYVAVCRPLRKRLSVRTSLLISGFCTIFTVVMAVPSFALTKTVDINGTVICRTIDTGYLASFRKITFALTVVSTVMLTLVCYTLVWKYIRRHRKVRNTLKCRPSTASVFAANGQSIATDKMLTSHFVTSTHGRSANTIPSANNYNLKSLSPEVMTRQSARGTEEDNINLAWNRRMDIDERSSETLQGILPNKTSVEPSQVAYHVRTTESNGGYKSEHTSADSHFVTRPPTLSATTKQGSVRSRDSLQRQRTVTFDFQREGKNKAIVQTNVLQRVQSESKRMSFATDLVQRRLTMMLFLATVVSVLTMIPMIVVVLLPGSVIVDAKNVNETLFSFIRFLNIVGVLNTSTNPFIYGLVDKKFRRECRIALRW